MLLTLKSFVPPKFFIQFKDKAAYPQPTISTAALLPLSATVC
jgi:hypothetical protein